MNFAAPQSAESGNYNGCEKFGILCLNKFEHTAPRIHGQDTDRCRLLMRPLGLLEIARTGVAALKRGV